MKARWIFLIGLLAATLAAAEDLFTVTGEVYTNVIVLRYDRKGYFIRHAGGDVKIPYKAILPELREFYKKKASYLSPVQRGFDETEDPPGPDDLATRSGRIYRDVVVKKVDAYAVHFQHDGGSAKVYFSEIADKAMRDKYRTATPVAPDVPPGSNDLVAADGQIFRHVEIRRVEPDGLTFRHDGGVTKLRFPALTEETQKAYGYDERAAIKYQRELADEKKRQKEEEAVRRALDKFEPQEDPGVAVPLTLLDVQPKKSGTGEFRILFAVQNLTGKTLSIRAIPYDDQGKALMGGERFKVPPNARVEDMDIDVPMVQPRELRVYCGPFYTNRVLRW